VGKLLQRRNGMAKPWPKSGGEAVELGSGFGTFTPAAAPRTEGVITALDIGPAMISSVRAEAEALGMR
jgi:ubiquinone/menaquinone biosynthesis C-methylase UbiE